VFTPSSQVKKKVFDIELALTYAAPLLSKFDFTLLSDIVNEWFAFPTLSSCLSYWKSSIPACSYSLSTQLQVILFNVRGLGERWEEVLLLSEKYKIDCLILTEVGAFELDLVNQTFVNFKYVYQKGENSWGGVLMLFRSNIPINRVKCDISNICVVDVQLETTVRLIGVYAPKSKTWDWNNLTHYITDYCSLFGDFNIDLNCQTDEKVAKDLLDWSNSLSLAPIIPETHTSLRSDRTIDYAFTRGIPLAVQTLKENTTSDHIPILGVLNCESKRNELGSNTHWKVYRFFLALTSEFWENESEVASYEEYYKNFITMLDNLKARCTTFFPVEKYRAAIPKDLRQKLSYVRMLSFRHKRTGDVLLHTKIKELRKQNRVELAAIRARRLTNVINDRFSSSTSSNLFWSKLRKKFKTTNSLNAFVDKDNSIVKDIDNMLDLAASHYGNLFSESIVYRPHPYVDSPEIRWDNYDDPIPPITRLELLKAISKVKKKHSSDAHGISSYMLQFIPSSYWGPLLRIFNKSFETYSGPSYWKHVKMKLLAKKESVCAVKDTRPISLLDIFLKILERLFLNRFQTVLKNRGILHESQSGFRSNFRLQTRVLNLIDQISSLMCTSTPVATLFVDFRQAFDQLWWDGCLGKLLRLGVPKAYVLWIESWLKGRSGFIEMNNKRSKFFPILRGGPQGSCLTPAIFITYHSDMWTFLECSLPNFFADDLACVIGGRLGVSYTSQCIDLEIKLKKLLDYLEFYSILSVQPINYEKTELLWSARAIGKPRFEISMGDRKISWVNDFKYLGYLISCKLGWSKMISLYKNKIRQRVGIIRSCYMYGSASKELKKMLFTTYVLPLFNWLFCIFPMLTDCQKDDFASFYYTCLKRAIGVSYWNDFTFALLYEERSLEELCAKYWRKFNSHLLMTVDGMMLYEHRSMNVFREQWLNREFIIKHMRRSQRLVPFIPSIEKCLYWLENTPHNSIPHISDKHRGTFYCFPRSFL
jgi:hypothetical protein